MRLLHVNVIHPSLILSPGLIYNPSSSSNGKWSCQIVPGRVVLQNTPSCDDIFTFYFITSYISVESLHIFRVTAGRVPTSSTLRRKWKNTEALPVISWRQDEEACYSIPGRAADLWSQMCGPGRCSWCDLCGSNPTISHDTPQAGCFGQSEPQWTHKSGPLL